MARRGRRPGDGLLHPIPVAAILALMLNDHWWKHEWPGWWTGKLSDLAGLIFFPLLLQAAYEWAGSWRGRWAPSRRVLLVSCLSTALAFTLVKLSPPAAEAYRWTWGAMHWPVQALLALAGRHPLPALSQVSLAEDPSDLLALPAVAVAFWVASSRSNPDSGAAPSPRESGARTHHQW